MKRYNLGVGEISWRGSVFLVLINYLIAYTKYYSLSKQKIKILNFKNYSRFDLNFFFSLFSDFYVYFFIFFQLFFPLL